MTTVADKITDFYLSMDRDWELPTGFELIDPFSHAESVKYFTTFYTKYFSDNLPRYFLLGINPGRHGAGITGIPFTDPKILKEVCGIDNGFEQKHELSAVFIYEMISHYGSTEEFYRHFYINSVCPLGFLRDGVNCNYYDDADLYLSVKSHIVGGIRAQIDMGLHTEVAFCLGKGHNFTYLERINKEYAFFGKIIPLPHPRWVMQYRRKTKDSYIEEYLDAFANVCKEP